MSKPLEQFKIGEFAQSRGYAPIDEEYAEHMRKKMAEIHKKALNAADIKNRRTSSRPPSRRKLAALRAREYSYCLRAVIKDPTNPESTLEVYILDVNEPFQCDIADHLGAKRRQRETGKRQSVAKPTKGQSPPSGVETWDNTYFLVAISDIDFSKSDSRLERRLHRGRNVSLKV